MQKKIIKPTRTHVNFDHKICVCVVGYNLYYSHVFLFSFSDCSVFFVVPQIPQIRVVQYEVKTKRKNKIQIVILLSMYCHFNIKKALKIQKILIKLFASQFIL